MWAACEILKGLSLLCLSYSQFSTGTCEEGHRMGSQCISSYSSRQWSSTAQNHKEKPYWVWHVTVPFLWSPLPINSSKPSSSKHGPFKTQGTSEGRQGDFVWQGGFLETWKSRWSWACRGAYAGLTHTETKEGSWAWPLPTGRWEVGPAERQAGLWCSLNRASAQPIGCAEARRTLKAVLSRWVGGLSFFFFFLVIESRVDL